MGLFFFHLLTQSGRHDDPFGLELPTVEAAYLQAIATGPELACELLRQGENIFGCSFEIADEQGRVLLSVGFDEACLQRREPPRPSTTLTCMVNQIEATHRKVTCARDALTASMAATRASLQEARHLVDGLEQYQRL